jgi:peptidyl-tRNA hydrolase
VLSRASRDEQGLIDQALARGLEALPLLVAGQSQQAMQQLHTSQE